MMSDGSKRSRVSRLRREQHATATDAQERGNVPPVGCAHAERLRAAAFRRPNMAASLMRIFRHHDMPATFQSLLHIKGFKEVCLQTPKQPP